MTAQTRFYPRHSFSANAIVGHFFHRDTGSRVGKGVYVDRKGGKMKVSTHKPSFWDDPDIYEAAALRMLLMKFECCPIGGAVCDSVCTP
jgi:hypothetical protein